MAVESVRRLEGPLALLTQDTHRDAGEMKIRRESKCGLSTAEEMWSRIHESVAPLFDYWPEAMLHPVACSYERSTVLVSGGCDASHDSSTLGCSGV